jgi:hypothetical protein
VSKENSPEKSHEAFAVIQDRMEEEGYINAGQIVGAYSTGELPEMEWGKVDAPITIRASYYYLHYYDVGSYVVTTQKSESIESYAIRLNELIKAVKERTGKDKVIIVAHSMGGLVSREYIALFGEDSVDKLIMIGTPNHGIGGRVKRLCSVVGSSKECDDMKNDSIFLKKLNSAVNTPKNTKFYTIRAVGCKMGEKDGDGIVTEDSVRLDFARNYVINGSCTDSLQSDLHTRFLNPDIYSKTYDIMIGILSET